MSDTSFPTIIRIIAIILCISCMYSIGTTGTRVTASAPEYTPEPTEAPTPEPENKALMQCFKILYYDDAGVQQALPFALRNGRQGANVFDGPLVFNLYLGKYLEEQYKPPVITITDFDRPLVTAWHDEDFVKIFNADLSIYTRGDNRFTQVVNEDRSNVALKDLEPGDYMASVSIYASAGENHFVTGACYLYFIIPEH